MAELVFQTRVLNRHLLDLDDEAHLAQGQLDDLLEIGDLLAFARVQAAKLAGGEVAHQPGPIGGPLKAVVVDDHEPAVG